MSDKNFLIWTSAHGGAWYRKESRGYTINPDIAGRFTEKYAANLQKLSHGECVGYHETSDFVREARTLHMDTKRIEIKYAMQTMTPMQIEEIMPEIVRERAELYERAKLYDMGGYMSCDYAAQHYGVPACIGRRVIAYGKPGVIAEDRGHHLGILLDCDKPTHVNSYHPVDGIEYLDETGKVRKPSRFQARYQRYHEYGDGFNSFIDFCRWDACPERSWNGGRQ